MFRAATGPSSGDKTVFMRHLVLVCMADCLVCRVERNWLTKYRINTVASHDDGPLAARNM